MHPKSCLHRARCEPEPDGLLVVLQAVSVAQGLYP